MRPTMEELLAEECEHFTSGTCADPGSGKIPSSDTGTWNQYCSPCRLRFAWAQQEDQTAEHKRRLAEAQSMGRWSQAKDDHW